MKLDKELYRQAYQQYLRWNEQELANLASNPGEPSLAQLWHDYLVAMADFDWEALSDPVDWARAQDYAEHDHWYACVFRLET